MPPDRGGRRVTIAPGLHCDLSPGRRIVVLAPHPDDETLGCGLLLARLARQRVPLAVVAMTRGDASHPASRDWPPAALAGLRRQELAHALARLGAGAATIVHMGWPDGDLAARGRGLRLAIVLRRLAAGAVLVTSPRDHHADHRASHALACHAAARLHLPLFSYEVWSRIAEPTRTHTWSPFRAARRRAIAAHRRQLGQVVRDDPQGFRLDPVTLQRFATAPEVYGRVTGSD
jgi:LmbE family N-acetylglucosaminyl deacetylase